MGRGGRRKGGELKREIAYIICTYVYLIKSPWEGWLLRNKMFTSDLPRNLFYRQGFTYDYVFDWNTLKDVSNYK